MDALRIECRAYTSGPAVPGKPITPDSTCPHGSPHARFFNISWEAANNQQCSIWVTSQAEKDMLIDLITLCYSNGIAAGKFLAEAGLEDCAVIVVAGPDNLNSPVPPSFKGH